MQEKYNITDAELEIMQVLWKKKQCNLTTIIEELSNNEEKNTEYNICGAVHGNYRRAFTGGNSNAVWGAAHFADLCRSAVRLCFGH